VSGNIQIHGRRDYIIPAEVTVPVFPAEITISNELEDKGIIAGTKVKYV
jgi:hypothetical protein